MEQLNDDTSGDILSWDPLRLRSMLDSIPVPLLLASEETRAHTLYVNERFQLDFGYSMEEIGNVERWAELAYPDPDYRQAIMGEWFAAFEKARQEGGRIEPIEARIHCRDGSVKYVVIHVSRLDGTLLVTMDDITAHVQIAERLRESEHRFRLLSENAHDVIWTMSPDGKITYLSPMVEKVRGYTVEEAMRQTLDEIETPESAARTLSYFGELSQDLAAGRAPRSFRGPMEYLCKDGSTYWAEVFVFPIMSADGSLVELLGVSRDISEFKRFEAELLRAQQRTEEMNRVLEAVNRSLEDANEQLHHLASIDALTGLLNRRHFTDEAEFALASDAGAGSAHSLMIFDLDSFKQINDRFGHQAGDSVLCAASDLIRAGIRMNDLAARWGGEEFLILLPRTLLADATALAESLRHAFESGSFPPVDRVTASFGVAQHHPGESLDELLARVDEALYRAKSDGRNCVRIG